MKELVVVSGKGGTGKTSIAASFAALAAYAVTADCDVDAADLHLVLAPTITHREQFQGGHVARINEGKCLGCGACLARCRFGAVVRLTDAAGQHMFLIDETACEGCGVCVHFCPLHAIDFPEKISGEWFVSETPAGPLVHATLGIAEENSGKLVTVIRNEARRLAESQSRSVVIVDGSPGIGCPVIASITAADLALIVAEPTVSGLHDFERIAKLAARLDVPAAMCVNKADLNDDMADFIESKAASNGNTTLGRIPYDSDVTAAQRAGQTVVEFSRGPAAQAIEHIWQEISLMLIGEPDSPKKVV